MKKYIDINTNSIYSFYPETVDPNNLYEISEELSKVVCLNGNNIKIEFDENSQIINIIPLEEKNLQDRQKEQNRKKQILKFEQEKINKLEELRKPYPKLNNTDYKIIKAMEYFLISQPDCSAEILEAHALRQAQRDLINARELESAEQ